MVFTLIKKTALKKAKGNYEDMCILEKEFQNWVRMAEIKIE